MRKLLSYARALLNGHSVQAAVPAEPAGCGMDASLANARINELDLGILFKGLPRTSDP